MTVNGIKLIAFWCNLFKISHILFWSQLGHMAFISPFLVSTEYVITGLYLRWGERVSCMILQWSNNSYRKINDRPVAPLYQLCHFSLRYKFKNPQSYKNHCQEPSQFFSWKVDAFIWNPLMCDFSNKALSGRKWMSWVNKIRRTASDLKSRKISYGCLDHASLPCINIWSQ